ncbi:MAG: NAD(P)H-binding protein [Candidatus Limnocylindrales bacterium]
MKIAITGGTGFVGSHLAERLAAKGHEVVLIGRTVRGSGLPANTRLVRADITDELALAAAFAGCDAVVHCAGINREIGQQTYPRIHVAGTRAVVEASRAAGVGRLVMLSFLRARPDGPTAYHRSKWQAEELVRASGLTWTILKAGVIHGRGDHMLDHLSHAFFTFPVFGLVGLHERPVRPVAVDDVARVLEAAVTGDPRLADRTVAVLGPEEMPLGEAVRRVARVTGRRPWFVRLPIWIHLLISRVAELAMRVPLVSLAQVRILQEGVTVPAPAADALPADLAPATPFSEAVIRAGLPPAGGFGRADLRWCAR